MEEWLHLVTKDVVVIIDAMAPDRCRHRNCRGFFTGLGAAFPASAGHRWFREVLARYGHWLVAGLTFQLVADIIETSITPTWQEVGQLGAIAVIRTFLNYFLERDLAELETERVPSPRLRGEGRGEGPAGAEGLPH
jgi:hypothetical protein